MRLTLLVNSTASSVTARARVVIQKALSADHEVTLAETTERGHATRLAREAAGAGMDAVVVLGGDGSLNEAVNGLAGTSTALGVLPGGSTNVFARTIGMTNDPIEATGELLHAIQQESIRNIGLGSVNGRYFLFHVGVGFDAAVVARVERKGALKRYFAHPLFVYTGIKTWFLHYDRSEARFSVHYADGSTVEDGYQAIALQTNPYTFLGNLPLNVAPGTNDEPGLTMTVFRTLSSTAIAGFLVSAFGSGKRLRRHPRVDYRSGLSEFHIEGHRPVPYQVDGEYLGEAERLEFRHQSQILRLYVP